MRVAAVIIKDKKILLMHRFKNGEEYFTLLGGSVEENENLEQALIREVKEESNLDISGLDLFDQFVNSGREECYFVVQQFNGDLKLGEPEASRQEPDNKYILEWVNFSELAGINLLPIVIKNKILDKFIK